MQKESFKIKGMTCNSCVKRIEHKVSELNGVKKISVNLEKKNVYVEFDNEKISLNNIKEAIFQLGYKVEGLDNEHGFLKGILYALLPHTGCFAIIILTILGITAGATILRPLLNSYFFYGMIGLSVLITILSAIYYLRKNSSLNKEGIKNNWKYLSILFGTTIIINVLLLTVIFPTLANVGYSEPNLDSNTNTTTYNQFAINVNIPCSGHASLIIGELKKDPGVISVKYGFPSKFTINYESNKTNKENILNNPIFEEYPAKAV